MDIKTLLSIYQVVLNLKKESRAGWNKKDSEGRVINSVPEAESVADHSYGVIILCLIIGLMRGLSIESLLIMAILHDLPEGVDGDQITADINDSALRQKIESGKKVRELEIIKLIFADLPSEVKDYFIQIFEEFQENHTPEAQLVNQLDKVETIAQSFDYLKCGHLVRSQEFVDSYISRIKDQELIAFLGLVFNQKF